MKYLFTILFAAMAMQFSRAGSWIRINQLGYLPSATKVAVFMSEEKAEIVRFEIVDAATQKVAYAVKNKKQGTAQKPYIVETGQMGGMKTTARLNFSEFCAPGQYYIRVFLKENKACKNNKAYQKNNIGPFLNDNRYYLKNIGHCFSASPKFKIGNEVYNGAADFVLNYMRQQRCGWNPFLRDSCHVNDGMVVGFCNAINPDGSPRLAPDGKPLCKDSTRIDVRGGWHDASDCLQYTTTSANAIYQMMFAYIQNPTSFGDCHKADGTEGANGIPDIVDEIYWGLLWLDKMNPAPGEMYNQIADDRDHIGMRIPHDDKADYGWGKGSYRPVWYCSGEPQQRGKKGLKNNTTGVASTAGKFASDFALGSKVLAPFYPDFAAKIGAKAQAAYLTGKAKPGVCQTASVLSPYIYEEDNWTDDMELAAMELFHQTGDENYMKEAVEYARREPVTPWMGADSARHYQWYPFMNMGHYLLAKEGGKNLSAEFVRNLRSGIMRTMEKAKDTPFLYGIPGIWCSNNLTTAMLTQCILYRQLTGNKEFEEMEGALRDWLLGCNPWGVSMIAGFPQHGTFPTQPHSFIIKYKLGNTLGGLVDGPVYSTIFNSLLGISTEGGINYEEFQPGDRVYHDSTHDYSTNEPTMDGTACLTFPFSAYQQEGMKCEAQKVR